MYSVLAAMGLLDHGIKSPLGEPQHFTQKNVTKQDYKLSQWVWTKVLVSQKWRLTDPFGKRSSVQITKAFDRCLAFLNCKPNNSHRFCQA